MFGVAVFAYHLGAPQVYARLGIFCILSNELFVNASHFRIRLLFWKIIDMGVVWRCKKVFFIPSSHTFFMICSVLVIYSLFFRELTPLSREIVDFVLIYRALAPTYGWLRTRVGSDGPLEN